MNRLREILYPELRRVPAARREHAWRQTRRVPFDVVELLGIALGLVVIAALTGYGASLIGPPARAPATGAAALIALALLPLLVGPFLIRRTRRALRMIAGLHGA